MSMLEPHTCEPVDDETKHQLSAFHTSSILGATTGQHTLNLDGHSAVIPETVYRALHEVLRRFSRGDGVVIGSTDALLTTSQAAALIGISATYLLRLLDNGTIPVEYRGTHRRIRLADATAYLASRTTSTA
jgi:excisionase family DNA binding protein